MATETALKFVLVGDSNVGKSQLSYRFCKEKFNVSSQSTVGIEFATRTIDINDCLVKSQLWDTAGQVLYCTVLYCTVLYCDVL
jgi:small GTP-binding protein